MALFCSVIAKFRALQVLCVFQLLQHTFKASNTWMLLVLNLGVTGTLSPVIFPPAFPLRYFPLRSTFTLVFLPRSFPP